MNIMTKDLSDKVKAAIEAAVARSSRPRWFIEGFAVDEIKHHGLTEDQTIEMLESKFPATKED